MKREGERKRERKGEKEISFRSSCCELGTEHPASLAQPREEVWGRRRSRILKCVQPHAWKVCPVLTRDPTVHGGLVHVQRFSPHDNLERGRAGPTIPAGSRRGPELHAER